MNTDSTNCGHENSGIPQITLLLQFQLGIKPEEDEKSHRGDEQLVKKIIVELDSCDKDAHCLCQGPIRVINDTTAAILQLLAERSLMSRVVPNHAMLNSEKNTKLEVTAKTQRARLLTRREIEVLNLLVKGASNREMALKLGVSENTIKFHVKNVLSKLQVKNRTQLVAQFNQLLKGLL